VFENKNVIIKICLFLLKASVLFNKNTKLNNKKSRPTARDGRRTGGPAVGFFVVFLLLSMKKHDFMKKLIL